MYTETILLTGGTGYLGSWLLPMLLKEGYKITLLKRSFSACSRIDPYCDAIRTIDIDTVKLSDIFENTHYDYILHCATNYGRKSVDPIEILESNLILPLQLLDLGTKCGTKCFINTDTIIDKDVNQYSLSKSQFKEWLMLYSDRITCINVALEHFFGPGDDESKFIGYITKRLFAQDEVIELSPGHQKRDFIYISDVVNAFRTIIEKTDIDTHGFTQFEVGSGNLVTIRELVEDVARIIGNSSTFLHFGALPYREHEVMESQVDLSLLKKFGWRCETSLRDGLVKTIEYEREKRI